MHFPQQKSTILRVLSCLFVISPLYLDFRYFRCTLVVFSPFSISLSTNFSSFSSTSLSFPINSGQLHLRAHVFLSIFFNLYSSDDWNLSTTLGVPKSPKYFESVLQQTWCRHWLCWISVYCNVREGLRQTILYIFLFLSFDFSSRFITQIVDHIV